MRFAPGQGFVRPEDFSDSGTSAFDWLMREARATPKMMSVGLHLRSIGRPGRIRGPECCRTTSPAGPASGSPGIGGRSRSCRRDPRQPGGALHRDPRWLLPLSVLPCVGIVARTFLSVSLQAVDEIPPAVRWQAPPLRRGRNRRG
jgi:hypothetical protein